MSELVCLFWSLLLLSYVVRRRHKTVNDQKFNVISMKFLRGQFHNVKDISARSLRINPLARSLNVSIYMTRIMQVWMKCYVACLRLSGRSSRGVRLKGVGVVSS